MPTHAQPPAEAVSNSATYLTKPEAAELLKVSQRFIERQVRAGRLRALKLSSKVVRFSRRDLDSFLNRGASFFVARTGVGE
jgi:excisionase family DNA binding protein